MLEEGPREHQMDEDQTIKMGENHKRPTHTEKTIQVKDLIKRHGQNEIIKGISMDVHKGEVAVVIGPSGGGKSTFIRCLNGLEVFQGGEVRVGQYQMMPFLHPSKDAKLLQAVRQRVGFVFQSFNLFPHMTVTENIIEGPVQVLKNY
jgi:ABC-type polar amino acid transport system ATPase subunit